MEYFQTIGVGIVQMVMDGESAYEMQENHGMALLPLEIEADSLLELKP